MTHKNARDLVGLAALANCGVAIANVSVSSLAIGLVLVAVFFLVGD